MTASHSPIVIIGAGAAGLMAAVAAVGADRDVLVLERTKDGGRKILISGGGRCNVLPSHLEPARFVTASSPNTLRRILRSWPLEEQRRFFDETLGVPLALETETGKLFPASNRARDVRDALIALARSRGIRFRFDTRVTGLRPPENDGPWRVDVDGGDAIEAAAVVVATGGLSVPATGSDGTGLRILERLGHTVHPVYPALTPLTADPPRHAHLAGISLDVALTAPLETGSFTTRGGFLFTHRGYSGPAVLDISHHAVRSRLEGRPRQPILVSWSGRSAAEWETLIRQATSSTAGSLARRFLPDRLADTLLAEAAIDPRLPLAQTRRVVRRRLLDTFARYPLPWSGDEGYRKAEVTGGGVALGEVDPRTLESRLHPGLFLCGEVLDAFGPIGGHNFLWAWTTGRAAGTAAAA